jgi:hypothetical protein
MQSRMKSTTGRRNRHGAQAAGTGPWIEHLLDPLPVPHHAVRDACVESLAYDRATQYLEVRYKGNSVHQYRPVSLQGAREIWRARPTNTAIDELLKKDHRIRFDYVRTEGKLLASLLRGWAMIAT